MLRIGQGGGREEDQSPPPPTLETVAAANHTPHRGRPAAVLSRRKTTGILTRLVRRVLRGVWGCGGDSKLCHRMTLFNRSPGDLIRNCVNR